MNRKSALFLRHLSASLFLAIVPLAAAQVSSSAAPPEEVVGCGKGAALARRFLAGLPPGSGFGPEEAMGDTDVLHYLLDIEVSNVNTAADTCTIAGSNTITIESHTDGLTQFTFQLGSNYTVTGVTVDGSAAGVSLATLDSTTRRVSWLGGFDQGTVFTIRIDYTGTSADAGLGAINVASKTGDAVPVVFTLSEPFYGYTWWPSKDGAPGATGDNSDKATVEVKVTVPDVYYVISNGLLQSVDTLTSPARKRYSWATNYPIASYLVCFSATNYNTWTQNYAYPGGSMPVQFFIYPGNDTAGNRTSWEKAVAMLPVFRTVYGEYPFIDEKYGIYNFNFNGGMEHQTITGQGTFSESVTSHELTHQWYGDMVTCKTWRDIWLNEGFATYGEALWIERRAGGIDTAAYLSAMVSRKPTSFDGSVYISDPEPLNVNRIFSSTYSYRKGGWVLHMLRHLVGDATFFQTLADYRGAYEFSAATTDNFRAVAESRYGQSLTWFFNQWVLSKGAPAYQLAWQSALVNGQNYFLARIAQTHSTAGWPTVFTAPVDLRLTIGGSPQTRTVWNDARTEWFVVPVSGTVTAAALDPDQYILRSSTVGSTAYVPGPPKIISVTPAPGSVTPDSPSITQLKVWFHTPVNASAAAVGLSGAIGGPVAFSLAGTSNVNPLTINLAAPLAADDYTLTLASSITAVNSGLALDGEIANPDSPASLPSGDGLAGGAATLRFSITPTFVPLIGDIDGNGMRNATDLFLFVQVLLGLDADLLHTQRSDINANGSADGDDVQPFVTAYLGP
ncbi:MAG: M1 family aminopeptidase [Phycisphaerae bacterium]